MNLITTATPESFVITDEYFGREYCAFRDLMGATKTTGVQADRAFSAIMLLWLNRAKDSKLSDNFIVTLTKEFSVRRYYLSLRES